VLYRCRRSRETHDKRHREIAVLVEAILQIDETNGLCTPLFATKRKARKNDNVFDIARDADDASVYEGDVLDNTRVQTQENTPPSLCTPTSKEAKRGQKLKKMERKMAKSQSRVKVISTEDIRRIADAIHPTTGGGGTLNAQSHSRQNSDDPLDSKLVADNVAYVSATSEYYKSRMRKDYGAKKAVKSKTAPPQTPPATPTRPSTDETVSVLARLNVKVIVLVASKERKSLVAKLQDAIHTDLTIMDNEDRDTMMREAGYFRYVNRRTYNAMIRNNQIWDWVSGRKLEEVDEDDDETGEGESDDVAVVDDDDDDCAGMGRERVIEDYGEDFVFDGEERQPQLQLAHRLLAAEDLDTDHSAAPLETNVSSVTPSPATEVESSAPCDVAEPVTPHVTREEFVLKLSMASLRKGAAAYVRSFDRDADGDGGTERKREQEQEQELPKQVDTTYAITNLEPEVLWA